MPLSFMYLSASAEDANTGNYSLSAPPTFYSDSDRMHAACREIKTSRRLNRRLLANRCQASAPGVYFVA